MMNDNEFVIAWRDHNSLAEVAAALNTTTAVASANATRLRKAGVNLKKCTRCKKPAGAVDATGLNALLEQS